MKRIATRILTTGSKRHKHEPKTVSAADTEASAERYLRHQGLKPICRNYRGRRGEIDLVMREGDELVFVEVRQRARRDYGSAAATVGPTKQRRLVAAASEYLQRHGEQPCRFDVVAFEGQAEPAWIRDAFNADD